YPNTTSVPISTGVTANYNGGGVSFSGFSSGTYDNILRVTPTEVPSLASNFGPGGENEYLWVTGFPVYDQNAKSFALLDAGGALQLVFSKPIPLMTTSNSVNNAVINIAGQNWTIIGGNYMGANVVSSTSFVQIGTLDLAQSMTPLTTVYVGHNITSGNFTVQVADLGQPASGVSPADINVYYKGALTNTTEIMPPSQEEFNVSGQRLYVKVNQTFAGLYAYEKWAKLQLFSNEYNITNGQVFNKTSNPGWNVFLNWGNSTASTSGSPADELYGIVLYNTSPIQTLLPGQSFDFLTSPAEWKLTFVGETLPTGNFDPLTITTSSSAGMQYENVGTGATGVPTPKNITEPAQLLTVKSSIPGAFTYQGQSNSTVTYDLTPYALYEVNNALKYGVGSIGVNAIFNGLAGNFIGTTSNPSLTVTVSGYSSNTVTSTTSNSVTFNGLDQSIFVGNFYNITNVRLSQAIPGANVVLAVSDNAVTSANTLAYLAPIGPVVFYPVSGYSYPWVDTSATNVNYNQGNGQPQATFTITPVSIASGTTGAQSYFSYSIEEFPVPTNTVANDLLSFDIVNSTAGASAALNNLFQLNYSATTSNTPGTHNNMTYTSTSGASFNVQQGFRTEKGSEVASISPTSLTVDLAKSVDMLQFAVGPVNATVTSTKKVVGPFGIGQATNLPNVTIANVTAKCSFASNATTGCTVEGLSNLTAVPSVSQAITPVKLNTVSTPLVVLDTNANPASTLIVVGSKYVNSVAAQIFAQNPSLNSSFGPSGPDSVIVQAFGTNRILVAGYYANQTVQAGNEFINDLLAAASS
ncbi:MAG: hypothetical protein QXS17_01875, partial [Candidatus Micrarchaeaceae archaeon]